MVFKTISPGCGVRASLMLFFVLCKNLYFLLTYVYILLSLPPYYTSQLTVPSLRKMLFLSSKCLERVCVAVGTMFVIVVWAFGQWSYNNNNKSNMHLQSSGV